jgi:hypothetical protein
MMQGDGCRRDIERPPVASHHTPGLFSGAGRTLEYITKYGVGQLMENATD